VVRWFKRHLRTAQIPNHETQETDQEERTRCVDRGFSFDVLDATKLIPEELMSVTPGTSRALAVLWIEPPAGIT